MKLAILSTLLLTFASKSDGRRGASLPTRPPNPDLCYRICVAIHHDPDQIEQCKDRCNTSSDEASSFVASSTSEERTPSLEDGAALSIPAIPVCYRACALIFHNPDQIKLCQDNCNLSSDEASSFVASSASEERTPSLEDDKDDLGTSGAFLSEAAAAVGLRGSKPSEAQTDEYDGFQSDKAV